jgi:hypothetical protein
MNTPELDNAVIEARHSTLESGVRSVGQGRGLG